jgi:CSLREA domain-containing protein
MAGTIRVAQRLALSVVVVVLTAALFLVLLPASAAATWHVTSSADDGDGDCQSAVVGDCTLRDAVDDAASGDSIFIDPTYSPALDSTIVLDKSLTIIGQGAAMTAISGRGSNRPV